MLDRVAVVSSLLLILDTSRSNCLMTSGAAFGCGDQDSLRALLIAPNGNLAVSQISLADDCEFVNEGVYVGDDYSEASGILRYGRRPITLGGF